MRIVILMGGSGTRFSAVGYQKPKPLLRIDGKAVIEHLVSMYPGNHEFIFVSHERFADDPVLHSLKKRLSRSRTIAVPSHKLGPVHSLSLIWDTLPSEEPVVVSYCDFNMHWNFSDFLKKASTPSIAGVIPCYTGFHPHILRGQKYAGVVANTKGEIKKIREKHCFTKNPEDSFHSAGNYYFARAGEMRQYGKKLIKSRMRINGEMYVSMMYYYYLDDGKKVLVHPVEHFLQWGTPEDLEEYEAWSSLVCGTRKGITDIPENRREHVRIPYGKSSSEYQRSFNYWKKYFSK